MSSRARRIVVFAVVLIASAASVGYLMWNKPHQAVAEAQAVPVTAEALYKSFSEDSTRARSLYLQRVLEVTGKITSISLNQQHQKLLLLQTAVDGASINCTFEDSVSNNIVVGNTVKVKGICSGIGEGDTEMGIVADVYLVRCYLVKD